MSNTLAEVLFRLPKHSKASQAADSMVAQALLPAVSALPTPLFRTSGTSDGAWGSVIVLMMAMLLCSCGAKPHTSQPEVRIAATVGTFGHIPVHLARALGYFEQEGLRVSLATLAGSAKVMEAVIGGSADVGAASLEQSIQMAAEGRPVQAFVLEFLTLHPLVVSPKASRKVGRIEDLSGAKVGITGPGSQTHFLANYLLAKHGVAEGGFTPIGISYGGTSMAAIEHGRVDAGFTSPQGLVVLQRRYPQLTLLFDPLAGEEFRRIFGVEDYPSHTLAAPAAWVKSNPQAARAVARSVVRALRYIREHPAEEVARLLPSEARNEDPSVDIDALRRWVPMFSADGVISEEGYEAVKRVVALSVEKVRTTPIDPRAVYTNEFVREAK